MTGRDYRFTHRRRALQSKSCGNAEARSDTRVAHIIDIT
jgi:hypothetical protein